MKPQLTFDRFIEVFVPGAILTIGTWYLHRPFLMVYFPAIASDAAVTDLAGTGLGARTFALLLVTVCSGVLTSYMSDVAIIGLFEEESGSKKASKRRRRWLKRAVRIWSMGTFPGSDPRVHAMNRYLESPREEVFLALLTKCCRCNLKADASPQELIIAHQHVVARLRVHSPEARDMVTELLRPVKVSSAIFTASSVLLPIGIAAFFTSAHVATLGKGVHVHDWPVLAAGVLALYLFSLVWGYSTYRQFKHFCAQMLTLGFQQFLMIVQEKGPTE